MKLSLRIKSVLVIVLMSLLISATAIGFSYHTYADSMDNHYKDLAVNLAYTATSMIDESKVQQYIRTQVEDEDYEPQCRILEEIRVANQVESIYILELREDTKEAITVLDPAPGFYLGHVDELVQTMPQDEDELVYISNTEAYGWMCTSMVWLRDAQGYGYAVTCVDISMNDVMADRSKFLNVVSLTVLVSMLVACVILVILVGRFVVSPINTLASAAGSFISDRMEKEGAVPTDVHIRALEESIGKVSPISQLDIRTGDEIQSLSEAVKTMEKEINAYIQNLAVVMSEKERIGAELDVATRIQASMLPCIFPAFPDRDEFEVYATMDPAKEVGGDFYDFFMVDEENLAVVVADVSGKGVPAALFMVIGKTLIKDHTTSGKDLGQVFTEVNQLLCESNSEELFITAFLGVLNLKTGNFRYINAGHEIPFLSRKKEAFKPYKIRAGFVLAGMEGIRYRAGQLQMEPGDKLFQYTDGVTEATDKDNQLFGMDRLEQTLAGLSDKSPTEILAGVRKDIEGFVGEAPQFDDITMLCLEYRGNPVPSITTDLSLDNIADLTDFVERTLTDKGASMAAVMKMNIALDEIYSNIVKFSGGSYTKISCDVQNGAAVVQFEDDGVPFDPLKKEDADISLGAEEREIGGLGILMVKKSMDRMEYRYENAKNILTLTKNL